MLAGLLAGILTGSIEPDYPVGLSQVPLVSNEVAGNEIGRTILGAFGATIGVVLIFVGFGINRFDLGLFVILYGIAFGILSMLYAL